MRGLRITTAAATIAAVVGVTAAGAGPSMWHEQGTPEGGSVYSLALGGDGTVYAGTQGAAFTSADGVHWQRTAPFSGLNSDANVDDLAAPAGSIAYAAVGGMLFKTTDAGAAWRRTDRGIPKALEPFLFSVATDAGNPDIVYAGSLPNAVYRSTDGGDTWSHTAYGTTEGGLPNAIAIDPVDPATVYVGTTNDAISERPSGGVYKTADGGASWMQLSIGLPLDMIVGALAIDPRNPRTIYAGTSRGVFKSTDAGLRWRSARLGFPRSGEGETAAYATVNDLAVDPADSEVVYAATSLGLATSRDGAMSWRASTVDEGHELSAVAVDVGSPRTLIAASLDRGALRSLDGGASWESVNSGLTAVSVMAVAVGGADADTVYVGTYASGLVKTGDGGRTWTTVTALGARTVRALVVDPRSARTLFVGTDDRGLLKSTDGGTTWTQAKGALQGEIATLAMDPRRPETLYAASSYQGLFKTVDGGASWRRTSSARVVVVAVDPARSSTVYAATGEAGVLVSDDAGKSWRTVAAGLPRNYDAEIRALTVAQRTREVYAAVNIGDTAKGDTTGVYRLKRGGARWTRVVAGLPRNADGALTQLRSLASHPRTGAVCVGTNAGLYELVASGGKLRWRLVDAIFAGRTVRRVAFAPDASRLYAATPGRLLVSR